MNAYQMFVKEHMAKMPAGMSPAEKMKKCAEMYRAQKGKAAGAAKHGRKVKGGILTTA